MTGIGPGSTNRQPAQPRHDAAEEPEISGATCLWSQRQIPHAVHAWKWGPVLRWCTGVDEEPAPRPSAAPRSPQSAGVAAGDGTDGPEPPQGTTGAAPGSVPEELCGEPMPILVSQFPKRCTKPKGHDVHMCRGHAWETDWDAWRAEIEREVRAKVAEEIEQVFGPFRMYYDLDEGDLAMANAIVWHLKGLCDNCGRTVDGLPCGIAHGFRLTGRMLDQEEVRARRKAAATARGGQA